MSYRFAFSLAALERPTSGAQSRVRHSPACLPAGQPACVRPYTATDGGAASYIAFLSFGRPGKLPRGVLLRVSPDIGCGGLEMPMTTLKLPMVVCRLGF